MNRPAALFVCALAALLLTPAAASAQTRIDLSAGIKGGVAMSAHKEVPDLTFEQASRFNSNTGDDAGFYNGFGAGAGFGLMLEARAWEVFGLETGLYYRQDDSTGWSDKTINGVDRGRVYLDQDTTALHIPVLLKVNAPTETIKPFLGLGLQFVIQQTSSIDYRGERENPNDATVDNFAANLNERNRIETSSYTMLQLTTGIEIDLGYIRIPVELRAGYNLGFDDSFEARVEAEQQPDGSYEFVYDGAYIGHFGVYTGVAYDWDLTL